MSSVDSSTIEDSVLLQPKVIDLLTAHSNDTHTVSFEYFPPKTTQGEDNLLACVGSMNQLWKPLFVDFTWGAGGSTSERTLHLCLETVHRHKVPVNMHLTCTNMSRSLIDNALNVCRANGIRNILALRGDPPKGVKSSEWTKGTDDGFTCALDLVRYIRTTHGDYFCITVAGYPEGHPDLPRDLNAPCCGEEDFEKDLVYLKQKVDAGADLIITQIFYSVDCFVQFVQRCRSIGITCPILPGLLPILSYSGFQRMTSFCKTHIPKTVQNSLEELCQDEQALRAYGIQLTSEMCHEIKLRLPSVTHFHFYTLNVDHSTNEVLRNLMNGR